MSNPLRLTGASIIIEQSSDLAGNTVYTSTTYLHKAGGGQTEVLSKFCDTPRAALQEARKVVAMVMLDANNVPVMRLYTAPAEVKR